MKNLEDMSIAELNEYDKYLERAERVARMNSELSKVDSSSLDNLSVDELKEYDRYLDRQEKILSAQISDKEYGLSRRLDDQTVAEGGREHYAGQTLAEATAFEAGMRKGRERGEDQAAIGLATGETQKEVLGEGNGDKAPQGYAWENGDGKSATLPEGETNEWGGNLRNEGRKPLIRRDENGKINGYSTTSSTTIQDDNGDYVVIPTVVNGEQLTEEDAKEHYRKTGEHWGKDSDKFIADLISMVVHERHQKDNQKQWNNYLHNNWDDVSESITNDEGMRKEHERRTGSKEEPSLWNKFLSSAADQIPIIGKVRQIERAADYASSILDNVVPDVVKNTVEKALQNLANDPGFNLIKSGKRAVEDLLSSPTASEKLTRSAYDSGMDPEDIRQAVRDSEGDVVKLAGILQGMSQAKLEDQDMRRTLAGTRIQSNEEGLGSKIVTGTIGMAPIIQQFMIANGVGAQLGVIKEAPRGASWAQRLATASAGAGKWTIPTMGPAMSAERVSHLLAKEYSYDPEAGDSYKEVEGGNGLLIKKGDPAWMAALKGCAGGYAEAAIFSLPIGDAMVGWVPKSVLKGAAKAFSPKTVQTVSKAFDNFRKLGQYTGFRGQPTMLALMDMNAIKDQVFGLGVKSEDWEGVSKEWDKITNTDPSKGPIGMLTAKGQLDTFISVLGMMAIHGATAFAKARMDISRNNRATDAVLHTYFDVPEEVLKKANPELKTWLRNILMARKGESGTAAYKKGKGGIRVSNDGVGEGSIGGELGSKFVFTPERAENFCNLIGRKLGDANGQIIRQMMDYALKSDGTRNWSKGIDPNMKVEVPQFRPRMNVPVDSGNRHIDWGEVTTKTVTLNDGTKLVVPCQTMIDESTGFRITKFLQLDAGMGDEGYVYIIKDPKTGNQATRFGMKDALQGRNDLYRAQKVTEAKRQNKLDMLTALYRDKLPGQTPDVYTNAQDYERRNGRPFSNNETDVAGYNPIKDKATFFLDSIDTPEQMIDYVMHEVGRHKGIRTAFEVVGADGVVDVEATEKNVQQFFKRLSRNNLEYINQLNHIARLYGMTPDEVLENPRLAEESFVASFNGRGLPANPTALQELANNFRRRLRGVFKTLPYSRSEQEALLRGALSTYAQQTGGMVNYIPESVDEASVRRVMTPAEEHQSRVERKAKGAEERADKVANQYIEDAKQNEKDEKLLGDELGRAGEMLDEEVRVNEARERFQAAEEDAANQMGEGAEKAKRLREAKEQAQKNERIDHAKKVAKAKEEEQKQRNADEWAERQGARQLEEEEKYPTTDEEGRRIEKREEARYQRGVEEAKRKEIEAEDLNRDVDELEAELKRQRLLPKANPLENKLDAEAHRQESLAGQQKRADRKAELAEYEKQEAERKAHEAKEEDTLQPQEIDIKVSDHPDAPKPMSEADILEEDKKAYREWLAKKNGAKDSAKNWNKFIMETGRNPDLRVKDSEKPVVETAASETAKSDESTVEVPKEEEKSVSSSESIFGGRGGDYVEAVDDAAKKLEEARNRRIEREKEEQTLDELDDILGDLGDGEGGADGSAPAAPVNPEPKPDVPIREGSKPTPATEPVKDDGYSAWLATQKDGNGNPLADNKASRKIYDGLKKDGKVDKPAEQGNLKAPKSAAAKKRAFNWGFRDKNNTIAYSMEGVTDADVDALRPVIENLAGGNYVIFITPDGKYEIEIHKAKDDANLPYSVSTQRWGGRYEGTGSAYKNIDEAIDAAKRHLREENSNRELHFSKDEERKFNSLIDKFGSTEDFKDALFIAPDGRMISSQRGKIRHNAVGKDGLRTNVDAYLDKHPELETRFDEESSKSLASVREYVKDNNLDIDTYKQMMAASDMAESLVIYGKPMSAKEAIDRIGSDSVDRILEAGGVRVKSDGNGIEMSRMPSDKQMPQIYDYLDWQKGNSPDTQYAVDLHRNGEDVSVSYSAKTSPSKIISDIRDFYGKGVRPEGTAGGVRDFYFNTKEDASRFADKVIGKWPDDPKKFSFDTFVKYFAKKQPDAIKMLGTDLVDKWNATIGTKPGFAQATKEEYNNILKTIGGFNEGGTGSAGGLNGNGGAPRDGGQPGNGIPDGGVPADEPGRAGGGVGEGAGTGANPNGQPAGVHGGNKGTEGKPVGGSGAGGAGQAPGGGVRGNEGSPSVNNYEAKNLHVPGLKKSDSNLEEPRGLRGTDAPDVPEKYNPNIDKKFYESGDLQEHQVQAIAQSKVVHDTDSLADGSRRGILLGHRMGAGKTRMVAGIMLDNWNDGRKKALWFSVNDGLMHDIHSDLTPFGLEKELYDVGDGKVRKGIGFATYSDIIKDGFVDKLAKELGPDFDGVIAFDECHKAKTEFSLDKDGNPETGKTQYFVNRLQDLLPRARVVYLSATSATEVSDLGYAKRLGLWGEKDSPFKDFEEFKENIKGKNLAGMEEVARTLKRRGQYLSCGLSTEGVDFQRNKVTTSEKVKADYIKYNTAIRDIYSSIYDSLDNLGDLGWSVPIGILHGMQQRMHNSMMSAVKLPSVIEMAKKDIAEGRTPIFSLVYTNAAGTERAVKGKLAQGEHAEMDETNFGPKQILLEFLTQKKPKRQFGVEYEDYDYPTMKFPPPTMGPKGEVIQGMPSSNPTSEAMRQRLIKKVEALPDDFGNPINMIMDAFGKENVANLTGINTANFDSDYKGFKDGQKKVLVFSKKANTGYSFHTHPDYANKDSQRVMYVLQPGWRADDFDQTLGRVHRNGQLSLPRIVLTETDIPGEARFVSSVARRKGQMDSFTQGDRHQGSNLIGEEDNYEDGYMRDAIQGVIGSLLAVDRSEVDDLARRMNFISLNKNGQLVNKLLTIDKKTNKLIPADIKPGQFFNRMMLLDPEEQGPLFDMLMNARRQFIQNDKDDGKFDPGLQETGSIRDEDLRTLDLADDMQIRHINSFYKTNKVSFDDFVKRFHKTGPRGEDVKVKDLTFVRNKRTGEVFAYHTDGTKKRGAMGQVGAVKRYAVNGEQERMYQSQLENRNVYEVLDEKAAKEAWDHDYAIVPDERAEDAIYARGDMLKHWNDVLGAKIPRTFFLKPEGANGEFTGALLDLADVVKIAKRFGKTKADDAVGIVQDSMIRKMMNGEVVEFKEGWKGKSVPRGEVREVMLTGFRNPSEAQAAARLINGQFFKREPFAYADKKRVFLPENIDLLHEVVEQFPVNIYDKNDVKVGDTGNLFFNKEEEALYDKFSRPVEFKFDAWYHGSRVPEEDSVTYATSLRDAINKMRHRLSNGLGYNRGKVELLPRKAGNITYPDYGIISPDDKSGSKLYERYISFQHAQSTGAKAPGGASGNQIKPEVGGVASGAGGHGLVEGTAGGMAGENPSVQPARSSTGADQPNTGRTGTDGPGVKGKIYQPELFFNKKEEARILEDPKRVEKYIRTWPAEDRKRIYRNFMNLKGTPWMKAAVKGISAREEMEQLLANPKKKLSEGSFLSPSMQEVVRGGEESIFSYLANPAHSIISHAAKPVLSVAGSMADCNPSKDCAKFCYTANGRGTYDNVISKAELSSLAIRLNPKRAAEITARQFMAMPDYYVGKSLRLLDRGDLSKEWIDYVRGLNANGVRAQIFSKRPEILREIAKNGGDKVNTLMLSCDESNWKVAFQKGNESLPVAVVWKRPGDNAMLEKFRDRFERGNGVVLPIMEGRKTLDAKEIKQVPEWARKHLCPIDAGWHTVGDWNCQRCDAKDSMGVGCFFKHTATALGLDKYLKVDERPLIEQQKDVIINNTKEIEDVISKLYPGREGAELIRAVVDLRNKIMAGHDPEGPGGLRKGNGGNADQSTGNASGRGNVPDSGLHGGTLFFNIDEDAGRRVHARGLDDAKRMLGEGASREDIWKRTGWWKAKDGKWRYEIPGITESESNAILDFVRNSGKFYDKDTRSSSIDSYAFNFDTLEDEMRKAGVRLPNSIKTLIAAYPRLAQQRIVLDYKHPKTPDEIATRGYSSGKEIRLYKGGMGADTFNHEVQHKIQEYAGMGRGTNPNAAGGFDRYQQEHGEWEARLASARARMTDEERANQAPWETRESAGIKEEDTKIGDYNRARIRPDGTAEPTPPPPSIVGRERSAWNSYVENFQDRFHALLEVERDVAGRSKKQIYADNSPYNAMRLLPGHQEAARMRYENHWKRPLEKIIKDGGITSDDVGRYMMAKDVPARNAKILARNGKLDGSGMTDAMANEFLADMEARLGPEKMNAVRNAADLLWKMQREGLERRLQSGRISAEMFNKWITEEPFHVPMRTDYTEESDGIAYSTKQWRRNDFKTAEGRQTIAASPVEFMLKEYEEAMYGSNENDARKVLANFIRMHPELGTVKRGTKKTKGWSFTHDQIEDVVDPYYHEQKTNKGEGRPNLVAFKDNGDLMMIDMNGKVGNRIAAAVIGRDVARMSDSKIGSIYDKYVIRPYASTATELSPTFGGRNFVADAIESALNTIADKGWIPGSYHVAKNIVNAIRMQGTINAYNRTGEFKGKFADVMRKYVESGASIGGAANEGYDEIKSEMKKIGGTGKVMSALKLTGRILSLYNKQFEMANRLAVFKDCLDSGYSEGESAMRSREYSTDFNKYGNQRWMNSIWMFSGSVMGSAVRQVESFAHAKHGVQMLTGLFAYGMIEALAESLFNAEYDDEAKRKGEPNDSTMTDYNRANSLYFRNGDRFYRLPFHAGPFSLVKFAGNKMMRMMLGREKLSESAAEVIKELGDTATHFTGIGDAGPDWKQTISPTIYVPFIQAGDGDTGKNFAGTPIQRKMYSETKPYSENGRAKTGKGFKAVARWLNEISGGNSTRRGKWDYSPEMLEHVWNSLGKNLTRDIAKVYDTMADIDDGKIDIDHLPFASDFNRPVRDNTQDFYDADRRFRAVVDDKEDRRIHPRSIDALKKIQSEVRAIRHWENGEKLVDGKWVPTGKKVPERLAERWKSMRLLKQQRMIDYMEKLK